MEKIHVGASFQQTISHLLSSRRKEYRPSKLNSPRRFRRRPPPLLIVYNTAHPSISTQTKNNNNPSPKKLHQRTHRMPVIKPKRSRTAITYTVI
jgi:hypothetical protein